MIKILGNKRILVIFTIFFILIFIGSTTATCQSDINIIQIKSVKNGLNLDINSISSTKSINNKLSTNKTVRIVVKHRVNTKRVLFCTVTC